MPEQITELVTNSIRCMQLNAARALRTVAEIRNKADSNKIQVMAIQEPFTIKGRIASFGSRSRVVSGEKDGETAWAGIMVFDPDLVVMRIEYLSDAHIVCAQIDNGRSAFYFISGYFQCSKPIKPYIERLSFILRQLQGCKVVIWVDANAKSPLWFAEELTEKGKHLEKLIAEANIFVVNELSEFKSYSRPGGEGNIDVTLTTEQAIRYVNNWEINDGWTSSDHNAITFALTEQLSNEPEQAVLSRFMVHKAKWDVFEKALRRKIATVVACNSATEVARLVKEA